MLMGLSTFLTVEKENLKIEYTLYELHFSGGFSVGTTN